MIEQLPPLSRLIKALQCVPYLASRNVYRVTSHFLDMDPKQLAQFCVALQEAQELLVHCTICYCWKEKEQSCIFCSAKHRSQDIICVVESWQELMYLEKTKGFEGVYHVLGGIISPLEGIGPEDLTIQALVKRVHAGAKEVILATPQTPEGEATAAYIAQKLKSTSVAVTCLARGLPVGSSLDSIDRVTMYKALSERRPF